MAVEDTAASAKADFSIFGGMEPKDEYLSMAHEFVSRDYKSDFNTFKNDFIEIFNFAHENLEDNIDLLLAIEHLKDCYIDSASSANDIESAQLYWKSFIEDYL